MAQDLAAIPTMRYHTAQNYFTNVEKNLNPDSPAWNYDSIAKGYTAPPTSSGEALGLPTWKDELYFEYHRGVFTTQAASQTQHAHQRRATLDAEKLASLAWLDGHPYPADRLHRKLEKNHLQPVPRPRRRLRHRQSSTKTPKTTTTEVFHADNEITDNALKTLSANINTNVSRRSHPRLQPTGVASL